MINYSNVNALVQGGGSKRAYGFFESAKGGHGGGGLTPQEHDRRLGLREEAYEMRRQRGQARKVEQLKMGSDIAHGDRRREASAKLDEDITRMRAIHPVKLELDRVTHTQELSKKGDFHQQNLGFDRDRATARLDATKATDAYKLTHEVRRTRTMDAVKTQLTDSRHQQQLGHRADTQRQDLGHRQQAHTQRLTHFEDQVSVGMRRRVQPTSPQAGIQAAKPTSTPASAPASPPSPQPAVMPHPSVKVKPRRQAAASSPSPASPAPQNPAPKKPSAPTSPTGESFTPHQTSRMDAAVGDIQAGMGGRLRRSSFDTRAAATPSGPAPEAAARKPKRAPKRAQATAPEATPAAPAPSLRPRANAAIKLPSSEIAESVHARFDWDSRTVSERLKTQPRGERSMTAQEERKAPHFQQRLQRNMRQALGRQQA